MKSAKVILTKKCNRKCRGCVVLKNEEVKAVSFEDLFEYDELILTGGEPLLLSERVIEMIHRLKFLGYKGKIFLNTSNTHRLGKSWGVGMVVDAVDGIIYTIHNGTVDVLRKDLTDLHRLDKYLREHKEERAGKEDKLIFDTRVYSKDYINSLSYAWSDIQKRGTSKSCQIPEAEEVIFYDLEAEG